MNKTAHLPPIYIEGRWYNLIPYEEQETIINLLPPQIESTGEIYTCMPHMVKKLRKWAKSRPDSVTITQDFGDAVSAKVDRSWIKVAPKRVLTEEQRAAAIERLKPKRGDTA